jgi:hypothetical protein
MKIRLIIASDDDLTREKMIFTEDMGAPPSDFFSSDLPIRHDRVIEMETPSAFPLEYVFSRTSM